MENLCRAYLRTMVGTRDDIYNLQQCASLSSIASWVVEETYKTCGIFMNKYLTCTAQILSIEPHEGVPLELAQFIAFPYLAAPTKGECTKGLLL